MLVQTDPDVLVEPHLTARENLSQEAVTMIKQYGGSAKIPKKKQQSRKRDKTKSLERSSQTL